jgi:hypothetical protein
MSFFYFFTNFPWKIQLAGPPLITGALVENKDPQTYVITGTQLCLTVLI